MIVRLIEMAQSPLYLAAFVINAFWLGLCGRDCVCCREKFASEYEHWARLASLCTLLAVLLFRRKGQGHKGEKRGGEESRPGNRRTVQYIQVYHCTHLTAARTNFFINPNFLERLPIS